MTGTTFSEWCTAASLGWMPPFVGEYVEDTLASILFPFRMPHPTVWAVPSIPRTITGCNDQLDKTTFTSHHFSCKFSIKPLSKWSTHSPNRLRSVICSYELGILDHYTFMRVHLQRLRFQYPKTEIYFSCNIFLKPINLWRYTSQAGNFHIMLSDWNPMSLSKYL